jgi:flavin-dependent dehydrogenase
VLLAGDAASLVNPLSGEGIYYALASGRLAARAALEVPADPLPAYRRLLARTLGRHLRHASVLARAIHAPALAEAGLGAAAGSPAMFDTLVELGLGQARITPRLLAALPRGLARARAATRGTGSAPAG